MLENKILSEFDQFSSALKVEDFPKLKDRIVTEHLEINPKPLTLKWKSKYLRIVDSKAYCYEVWMNNQKKIFSLDYLLSLVDKVIGDYYRFELYPHLVDGITASGTYEVEARLGKRVLFRVEVTEASEIEALKLTALFALELMTPDLLTCLMASLVPKPSAAPQAVSPEEEPAVVDLEPDIEKELVEGFTLGFFRVKKSTGLFIKKLDLLNSQDIEAISDKYEFRSWVQDGSFWKLGETAADIINCCISMNSSQTYQHADKELKLKLERGGNFLSIEYRQNPGSKDIPEKDVAGLVFIAVYWPRLFLRIKEEIRSIQMEEISEVKVVKGQGIDSSRYLTSLLGEFRLGSERECKPPFHTVLPEDKEKNKRIEESKVPADLLMEPKEDTLTIIQPNPQAVSGNNTVNDDQTLFLDSFVQSTSHQTAAFNYLDSLFKKLVFPKDFHTEVSPKCPIIPLRVPPSIDLGWNNHNFINTVKEVLLSFDVILNLWLNKHEDRSFDFKGNLHKDYKKPHKEDLILHFKVEVTSASVSVENAEKIAIYSILELSFPDISAKVNSDTLEGFMVQVMTPPTLAVSSLKPVTIAPQRTASSTPVIRSTMPISPLFAYQDLAMTVFIQAVTLPDLLLKQASMLDNRNSSLAALCGFDWLSGRDNPYFEATEVCWVDLLVSSSRKVINSKEMKEVIQSSVSKYDPAKRFDQLVESVLSSTVKFKVRHLLDAQQLMGYREGDNRLIWKVEVHLKKKNLNALQRLASIVTCRLFLKDYLKEWRTIYGVKLDSINP